MKHQDVLVELDVVALRGGIRPENVAGRRAPAWWNRKHRQTLASLPVPERSRRRPSPRVGV